MMEVISMIFYILYIFLFFYMFVSENSVGIVNVIYDWIIVIFFIYVDIFFLFVLSI